VIVPVRRCLLLALTRAVSRQPSVVSAQLATARAAAVVN